MSLIEIQDIHFSYGRDEVIKGVSLKINQGEKVALIGQNGAGKSTLIDLMLGIKQPSKGKVNYSVPEGQTIQDISGVQFQTKDFPVGLKAKQLLKFYCNLYGMKITDKNVQELLKQYKLNDRLKVPLKQLSGGQQQKFNILIALLNNPKLLIVDELLMGLDITSQRDTIASLKQRLTKDKNLTFVTVSHSPVELNELVDRIVTVSAGKIVQDQSVEQIRKKHGTIEKYLNSLEEYDEN